MYFCSQVAADHTSHCKTNKYLIKVPLIIDGGHLAAVLCSVWPSGVKDQDVGWLSELSSVLQVPFWKRKKTLDNCSFTYTAWLHSSEKQNSMPSSFKVPFIRLSFESWVITLKCCGLTGWCGFEKKKRVSKRFTCYLTLKVHITGDTVLNLFPLNPWVVCCDGLY